MQGIVPMSVLDRRVLQPAHVDRTLTIAVVGLLWEVADCAKPKADNR